MERESVSGFRPIKREDIVPSPSARVAAERAFGKAAITARPLRRDEQQAK